ncbi:MAG: AMP-binding protein, partial [Alphaproteobacteria bacterium]|nr:AMP-binding protein [Alphaproteobacteria bacterium]
MPIVDHAAAAPDKIATIMAGSGKSLTYGQLNERSIRLSHYLHAVGLRPGDVVALFMENNIRYHEVFWAAVRSGMYVCAVNKFLTAEEVTYILNDSGSKALVTSAGVAAVAEGVLPTLNDCPVRLMVDGTVAGFECYEDEIAKQSAEP